MVFEFKKCLFLLIDDCMMSFIYKLLNNFSCGSYNDLLGFLLLFFSFVIFSSIVSVVTTSGKQVNAP